MQSPPLLVAVCTNRAPERIAPTLRALGEQLRDQDAVGGVIVANAPPGAEAELRALAEEAGLELDLFEPTGIAAARNRALELADPEGVIAFIDDDVIPASDWLERLKELWRNAPEDVGIIGG